MPMRRAAFTRVVASATVALGVGLATSGTPARAIAANGDSATTADGRDLKVTTVQTGSGDTATAVKYRLPPNVWQLYPFKWLPAPYKKKYTQLTATVEHFTKQSLRRGGIDFESVDVTGAVPSKRVRVRIVGGDTQKLRNFSMVHYQFFDNRHARQGKLGVRKCKTTSSCWDPNPGKKPWAFYLPLGLPLVGQKAVTLLDYPPSDSLMDRDYLGNFTMDRWSNVLRTVGIDNPVRYETIVDSRPIAAPGSGQSKYMPAVSTYFNDAPDGPDYIVPMLKLLSRASQHSPGRARPIIVLGDPARKAWGNILDPSDPVDVNVMDVGRTRLDGAAKRTPWVASNHPDVRTYQCCPGDKKCETRDQSLPKMTKIDLKAACIVKTMANNPGKKPAAIKKICHKRWVQSLSPLRQRKFCVLARRGYNFSSGHQCKTKKAAEQFCARFNNNPCPPGVFACKTSTQ